MAAALCTAIDAILQAERYASEKHELSLDWNFQDVQKIAITLYIDARKEAK
jgi:hypothetical protein